VKEIYFTSQLHLSPPFSITRAWPDHHTAFRSLPAIAFLYFFTYEDSGRRIPSHHRHRATEPGPPTSRSQPPFPRLSLLLILESALPLLLSRNYFYSFGLGAAARAIRRPYPYQSIEPASGAVRLAPRMPRGSGRKRTHRKFAATAWRRTHVVAVLFSSDPISVSPS